MSKHKRVRECPCGRNTLVGQLMICSECRRELVVDLQQIVGQPMNEHTISMDLMGRGDLSLAAELQVLRVGLDTVEKRRRHTNKPSSDVLVDDAPTALKPTALPVDEHALRLMRDLENLLSRWFNEVYLNTRWYLRPSVPASTEGRALYLLQNVAVIERAEFGSMMHDDVRQVVRRIRQAIDRPPDRLYAGPCDRCDGEVWAEAASKLAACDKCQWTSPTSERREWLLDRSMDEWASAQLIADASEVLLGWRITASQIRNWDARGRLTSILATEIDRVDGHVRVLSKQFRIGDVVALARQQRDEQDARVRRAAERMIRKGATNA